MYFLCNIKFFKIELTINKTTKRKTKVQKQERIEIRTSAR
uniref:Uncharacterized protein n=1 Tax=Anguilla anguilla TaxID=7936 RepID=A0A0E9W351_ANGAN